MVREAVDFRESVAIGNLHEMQAEGAEGVSDNSDIWFRRFFHGVLAVVVIVVFLAVCQSDNGQVAKVIVSTSRAQSCEPNYCVPGRQSRSYGSCVGIAVKDGKRYFLTAGHVVRGAQSVHISLDGGIQAATIHASTDEPDLALLSVADDGKSGVFPLYDGQVDKGTEVEFVGFIHGGRYSLRRGALLGYLHSGYIDTRITVDDGDSGGAVLLKGQTVGICKGYYTRDRNTSLSVSSEVCIAWLNSRGFNFQNQSPGSATPAPQPPDRTPPALPTDPGALLQIQAQIAELRVLIESGQLRGPAGKDGRNGIDGKQGPPGKDGRDGITPDLTAVESRIASLEARIESLQENSFIDVRWVNKDGSNPTETRRYRIGQDRIDLYRDQATVKGGKE